MELKYIVYITINQCNGKFYIGIHKTNPEVFDGYIGCGIYRQSNANKNFPFHNAVKKYGYDNFKRTTIQIFDTKEGALQLEKILVNQTLLKSKNCYNSVLGGGDSIRDEYNKKIYQFSIKGEFLRSFKNAREAAISIDPENQDTIRQAIKNNCRGATMSSYGYFWSYKKEFTYKKPSIWKQVAQYTLSGKFLRYYDNMIQAESELGITTISQALSKGFTSGGFQWKYFTGDSSDIAPLITVSYKNKVLPIIMRNGKTNQEFEYASINECVEYNPTLKASQINRVLKNIIKTHLGYTFRYKDEDIVQLNQK